VYDRGASRTNRLEAERIVADAVELLLRQRTLPASRRQSLGIITFNQQQQKLIEDLLDEQRQRRPDLEDCFSEGLEEPVIVRNLENVQGDERDVIFFSIAFGLNEQGHLPLTFGALNRAGGERRLNVAVTRARQRMVVYSSITGEQISGAGSVARGVRDLRNFLLFASDAAAVSRDPAETGPDSTPAS
ncbi:MAG: AAA domain-containing protein, partial [Planctomyces sp.]